MYGEPSKPTHFLALILKMLQVRRAAGAGLALALLAARLRAGPVWLAGKGQAVATAGAGASHPACVDASLRAGPCFRANPPLRSPAHPAHSPANTPASPQIQPDKDVVVEFIKNDDFKYLRLLGALRLRWGGTTACRPRRGAPGCVRCSRPARAPARCAAVHCSGARGAPRRRGGSLRGIKRRPPSAPPRPGPGPAGAFYLRLVGRPLDVYQYLEPLYNDYRKVGLAFALFSLFTFVWCAAVAGAAVQRLPQGALGVCSSSAACSSLAVCDTTGLGGEPNAQPPAAPPCRCGCGASWASRS